MSKYLTEFIGTFFLVLTVCLTVVSQTVQAPLVIGSVLMVMVYMGGHVSGGHYNPAVSFAVLLRGKLGIVNFIVYVIVQMLGAMAAANAFILIQDGMFHGLTPSMKVGMGQAFFVEFLFTFALALVVLNAATSEKTAGNSFYGLAIGFTVMVGAYAAGDVSGGAFNPAVGTGPTLVALLWGGGTNKFLWLYWAAPMAGAILAAIVFRIQESGATK